MADETVISAGPLHRIGKGTVLNGIYEIESLVAVGGMGEVYKGRAIATGDEVAIKTIKPEFAQNADALALFRKEASALHNLYHEAIVRYFLFSIDAQVGLPYLAMEYVEGQSLSDVLKDGPLSFDDLRILQKRLAAGLHAAHELGIVHRDVSPDNIILPGRNFARAKIIDFGIARSTAGKESTVIGSGFAGKFSYVSPEQLGLQGGDVTGKSDIYSLGLVLAEATLGQKLDMGQNHVQVIEKRQRVPDLGKVEPRIRPLLQAMLQPNPKDRPASMAEIASWLPAGSGPRAGKTAKRLALVAAILCLVGAGGAGYVYWPEIARRLPAQSSGTEVRKPTAELPSPSLPPAADLLPTEPQDARRAPSSPATSPEPVRETESRPTQPSVAALPPPADVAPLAPGQPEPLAPDRGNSVSGIERVTSYLRDYNGGSCFYVMPLAITPGEATIEAFGSTPAPFMAFDADFQRTLGFEPQINLRQITSQQCPLVEFMTRQASQRGTRAPKLSLRSDRVRSGQDFGGTVEARPEIQTEVFLVADDGLVYSLANYSKRAGDSINFSMRIEASGGEAKPQLVVAISSPKPLTSLKSSAPIPAPRFFRQLADETARNGTVGVATRYFKLGG